MRGSILLTALALISWSCGGPSTSGAPDPKGRDYNAYLSQGLEDKEVESISESSGESGDAMVLHFIDIGQGSATLVEFPCGAMLLDTGGEKNAQFDSEPELLNYLNAFFARRTDLDRTLDALVITHPHIDHTRSINAVLQRYRVRNIIDNGDVQDDLGGRPQLAMHEWLHQKNQEITKRNKTRNENGGAGIQYEELIGHFEVSSENLSTDGITNNIIDPIPACPASEVDPQIKALWGMRLGRREKGHNANNDSVVLRIDYGKTSALLSGDLELLSIAWMVKHYQDNMEILNTDIYYVPHHGSRNSTGEHWISQIKPRVAVISMGPYERHLKTWPEFTARSFGHPNKDAVDHVLNMQHGVSAMRKEPIEVMVGTRGAWKETPSEFDPRVVKRALYATGWDGHIAVKAHPDGKIEVDTSGQPASQ
jgi:competence protein ComEC